MEYMPKLDEVKKLLAEPRKIFITTHAKPDGDAMGSSLALFHYFEKTGHKPVVVAPTDFGTYLKWMPGAGSAIIYTKEKERAQKELKEADLVICLDFNTPKRTDEMEDDLRHAKQPVLVIDHHLEPEKFANYEFIEPTASATCELVYDFIVMLGDYELMDETIGTCLYTGIMTDTGSFRYASTTGKVHEIIAHLLNKGVEKGLIHNRVYDTFSVNRLKFFGYCFSEKLVYLPEYRTAFISVTKEEFRKFNVQTGDTEGLVNYPLTIANVVFAALFNEKDGLVKISFRSKGEFPASEVARNYFHGGGHLNAAGGRSHDTLEATIKKFTGLLPQYQERLLNV